MKANGNGMLTESIPFAWSKWINFNKKEYISIRILLIELLEYQYEF